MTRASSCKSLRFVIFALFIFVMLLWLQLRLKASHVINSDTDNNIARIISSMQNAAFFFKHCCPEERGHWLVSQQREGCKDLGLQEKKPSSMKNVANRNFKSIFSLQDCWGENHNIYNPLLHPCLYFVWLILSGLLELGKEVIGVINQL